MDKSLDFVEYGDQANRIPLYNVKLAELIKLKAGGMRIHLHTCILISIAAALAAPDHAAAQGTAGGFYAGAFISGNFVDMDVAERPAAPPVVPSATGSADLDGIGGGVLLGYDLPLDGAVFIGIVADASLADLSANYDGDTYESNFLATLRARAGIEVAPGFNLFGTAGIAFLNAEYVGTAPPPPIPPTPPATRVKDTLIGFAGGVGGEIDTGAGFNFQAEYLYLNFENWHFYANGDRYDVATDAHIVRFGFTVPLGN